MSTSGAEATSQRESLVLREAVADPGEPHEHREQDDAASRILLSLTAPQRRLPRPMEGSKIRVVVAKPGLDGHDRGAKIIARALRDAGMEVIYTGLHQTPEQIAETVIQEDAHAVGLSILSGAHMTLVPRVVDLLKQQGADDVVVTVGGTIPAEDIAELKELGVSEVFTPGSSTQEIVDYIRGAVATLDPGASRPPKRGIRRTVQRCPALARRG